jgi:hypothetical protein
MRRAQRVFAAAGIAGLTALLLSVVPSAAVPAHRAPRTATVVTTVTVDTTADLPGTTDGSPTTDCNSPCSLRKAAQYANSFDSGNSHRTVIHVPAGDYILSRPTEGDDGLAADVGSGGDVHIDNNTEIVGAGADNTIIEQQKVLSLDLNPIPTDRVLEVVGNVTITGVTIRGGHVGIESGTNGPGNSGGGILVGQYASLRLVNSTVSGNEADVQPNDSSSGQGGGIFVNNGFSDFTALTLDGVIVSGNQADVAGGGVYSMESMVAFDSSIVNNQVKLEGMGGGIFLKYQGIQLTNVTISGNEALQGGGLLISDSRNSLISYTTIAGNKSLRGNGGGLAMLGGRVNVQASIIANNTGKNCFLDTQNQPVFISLGNNLQNNNDCDFTQSNDHNGVNPHLQTLGMRGGSTPTMGLEAGSPAIDAIAPDSIFTPAARGARADTISTGCPPPGEDQRGVLRASTAQGSGSKCDIGAFEYFVPQPKAARTRTVTTTIPGLPRAGETVTAPDAGGPAASPNLALAVAGLLLALAAALGLALKRQIPGG